MLDCVKHRKPTLDCLGLEEIMGHHFYSLQRDFHSEALDDQAAGQMRISFSEADEVVALTTASNVHHQYLISRFSWITFKLSSCRVFVVSPDWVDYASAGKVFVHRFLEPWIASEIIPI